MSPANRSSGTHFLEFFSHFLNISVLNPYRRLISGRSDSSISDAKDQGTTSTLTVPSCTQGSTGDYIPLPCTEGETLSSPNLMAFTFNELKRSTGNFHRDSFIGEGGCGPVFKGWIDKQTSTASKPGVGMVVAVKELIQHSFQGPNEWLAEVCYLGQFRHPNLVKLIGFCLDGHKQLLVYEFMPRGSLDNHLFKSPQPLSWATRIKVAIGAAKGLAFLHDAESQVIHQEFKSSNILLDSDFNAKLSCFGSVMIGPPGDNMRDGITRVIPGYIAPECYKTGSSAKTGVYSFGVVLLELLLGRRAGDVARSVTVRNPVDWARPYLGNKQKLFRIMDSKLEGRFPMKEADAMAKLVLVCCANDPKLRPRMSEVLAVLEKLQDP